MLTIVPGDGEDGARRHQPFPGAGVAAGMRVSSAASPPRQPLSAHRHCLHRGQAHGKGGRYWANKCPECVFFLYLPIKF